MHSRGTFETLHSLPPVSDIVAEVTSDFRRAVGTALGMGVAAQAIALDVGIGFGKSLEQNLSLIKEIGKIMKEFPGHPFAIADRLEDLRPTGCLFSLHRYRLPSRDPPALERIRPAGSGCQSATLPGAWPNRKLRGLTDA